MTPAGHLPVLLPLYVHPARDPEAWRCAGAAARSVTVVVRCDDYDPEVAAGITRLADAGVAVLGYVDALFATRPVADLIEDTTRWADHPVAGVFFDQAPTSPFSLGPVALATRAARRVGLRTVVLNAAAPTDPLYRELGAGVCTFEGTWADYRRWDGTGSGPGDGHLVHSVPAESVPAAWAMLRQRRAGFGLVTDRCLPEPYAGAPTWLAPAATPTGVPS